MSINYERLRKTASSLLSSNGQIVTVRRRVAGAYSSDTLSAPITNATFSGAAAVFNYRPNELVDGVLRGDRKVLLEVNESTVEPQSGDEIDIGGIAHTIISVAPTAPGGLTVMYTIQARRGG